MTYYKVSKRLPLWVWFYSSLFVLLLTSLSPSLSLPAWSLFHLFYFSCSIADILFPTPPSSLQPVLCPSFIFYVHMSFLIYSLIFSSTYPTLWAFASYLYLVMTVISLCEGIGDMQLGDILCYFPLHTLSLLYSLSYFLPAFFSYSCETHPEAQFFCRKLWWLLITILWELFLSSLGFPSFSSISPVSQYSSLLLIPPFSPLSDEVFFTKRERIAKVG